MYVAATAVAMVTVPRLLAPGLTTTAVVLSLFSGALVVAGVIYGARVGRDHDLSLQFGPITILAAWGMAMALVGPLGPSAPTAACDLVVLGLIFGELLFLPNRLIYTAAVEAGGLFAYFTLSWTVFPTDHAVDSQSALVMTVLLGVAWMTAGEIARTRRVEFLAFTHEQLTIAALSEEIATRQVVEAELSWLAGHDTLTDLLTRRAFFEQADEVISSARRRNHPVSVLVVDADHFKDINDRFGHHTGDEVLRSIARACKTSVRADDVVGRLGGEEFALVMGGADLELAMASADNLRARIAHIPIDHPNGEVHVTVSIGVAQAHLWAESLPELLQRADAAMYQAKQDGRNRAVAFPNKLGRSTSRPGAIDTHS